MLNCFKSLLYCACVKDATHSVSHLWVIVEHLKKLLYFSSNYLNQHHKEKEADFIEVRTSITDPGKIKVTKKVGFVSW